MSHVIERVIDILFRYEGYLYAGGAILLSLILLSEFGPVILVLLVAILCVSILINRYLRYARRKRYEDERQHQIYGRAAWISVGTTLLFMVGLLVLIGNHIIPEMRYYELIIIIYTIMVMPLFG